MTLRALTRLMVTGSLLGLLLLLSVVTFAWQTLGSDLDEIQQLSEIQHRAAEFNLAADHISLIQKNPALIRGIRTELTELQEQLHHIDHYASQSAQLHLAEIQHILQAMTELNETDVEESLATQRAFQISITQIGTQKSGLIAALQTIRDDRQTSIDRSLKASLSLLAISALLLAGMSLMAFMFMRRRIVRPVQVLEAAIRQHQTGDLDARIPPLGFDELGQLGESFNRMAQLRQQHEESIESYQAKLEESLDRLRSLAYRDQLTDALSREGFINKLSNLLSEGHAGHGYVAAFNIIGMRDINETYGYSVGDALLRAIKKRISGWLNENGLVARVGGDEFVIFQTTECDEQEIANRIQDLFDTPFTLNGKSIRIETNFGLVKTGSNANKALRQAEIALFSVRHGHAGQWRLFTPEMEKETHERLRLTQNLQEAIHNQEFALHYQPQVDLQSGHLIGGEALIRWHHPTFGMQSPGQFIPVAERSKLIIPIGEWALREACLQLKSWQADHLPVVQIAVNVSLVQFLNTDFETTVKRILDETQTLPAELSLEITESVFDQESQQLSDQLKRLHMLGVKLSLDDFGTGYSSLRYIREYPFSSIKLDRSFVSRMVDDAYSRSICEMVIKIGKKLGAQVIAEGIEEEEERNLLLELGCQFGQGFLFSRPVLGSEFRRLLEEGKALPLKTTK